MPITTTPAVTPSAMISVGSSPSLSVTAPSSALGERPVVGVGDEGVIEGTKEGVASEEGGLGEGDVAEGVGDGGGGALGVG